MALGAPQLELDPVFRVITSGVAAGVPAVGVGSGSAYPHTFLPLDTAKVAAVELPLSGGFV